MTVVWMTPSGPAELRSCPSCGCNFAALMTSNAERCPGCLLRAERAQNTLQCEPQRQTTLAEAWANSAPRKEYDV